MSAEPLPNQTQPSSEPSARATPMSIHQIHHFLQEIHHKIQEQDKLAAATGENFNVFKILGLERFEVRTHSAFLSDLLNPHGTHGQGCTYLKLFLAPFYELSGKHHSFAQQLRDFDAESARLKSEDYIGPVDPAYTEGGRIDISLTDHQNRRIFIENKIRAADGEKQLRRYHNHDKKASLFYLTLCGTDPSEHSLGHGEPLCVKGISYQQDILQWLLQCRKEAATLPGIREALTQYIELVRHLTNQTARKTMKEEIKQLIVKNPAYMEAIEASWQSLTALKSEAENNFRDNIEKKLADQVGRITISNQVFIEVYRAEDGDGFYIGYRLCDGRTNISNSELGKDFAKLLHTIDHTFKKNPTHIGWHSPEGFKGGGRVQHLGNQLLLNFYLRSKELDNFTDAIVNKERDVRNALANAIAQSGPSQKVVPELGQLPPVM